MWSVIGGLFSLIGGGISSFFGFKGEQAKVMQQSIDLLSKTNDVDAAAVAAAAQIISAEANNTSWLASNWRPLFMLMFGSMICARWFGYTPPNMSPEELNHIYGLFELGLGGYIGSRGLEKMVTTLGIQKTLGQFITQKLISNKKSDDY